MPSVHAFGATGSRYSISLVWWCLFVLFDVACAVVLVRALLGFACLMVVRVARLGCESMRSQSHCPGCGNERIEVSLKSGEVETLLTCARVSLQCRVLCLPCSPLCWSSALSSGHTRVCPVSAERPHAPRRFKHNVRLIATLRWKLWRAR
ncbi:hypothetical protein EJ03DRAFT_34924 [Teratosphaeria nubilosa]|uniref:Uncharacterized protein n=1 Tax=Teratosphaeria nubilosa TaxID=161662 RepID=A0A6G1KU74_9PEZI|nr:hypothetical protein EJ03DRAFT_34924 [Teratosphaeria nubilosa]